MAKFALLTAGGVCVHQDPEDLAASSALLDTFLDHPLDAILADVELVHYPVSTHLPSKWRSNNGRYTYSVFLTTQIFIVEKKSYGGDRNFRRPFCSLTSPCIEKSGKAKKDTFLLLPHEYLKPLVLGIREVTVGSFSPERDKYSHRLFE